MRARTRFAPALLLAIAGMFIGASPSFAALITYTESATASGSLDGVTFTDATVLLSMNNDTTNVTSGGGGFFFNFGTATVSIGGGPAVTFTNPIDVFSYQPSTIVGFSDTTVGLDILDTLNGSFATYALTTSIGPITDVSLTNGGFSFPTSGGAFVLTSVVDRMSTFTATTTLAAVPEPQTWALMLVGFAGLGYAGYRRSRKSRLTAAARKF